MHEYTKFLGSVFRLLEVYADQRSTPRDRLLARRTWQHRPLVKFSDYVQSSEAQSDPALYKDLDERIEKLDGLRAVDPPPIGRIQEILDDLLRNIPSKY